MPFMRISKNTDQVNSSAIGKPNRRAGVPAHRAMSSQNVHTVKTKGGAMKMDDQSPNVSWDRGVTRTPPSSAAATAASRSRRGTHRFKHHHNKKAKVSRAETAI